MMNRHALFSARMLSWLLAGLLLSVTLTSRAEPKPYVLDPDHLSVGFLIRHIGYEAVLGMFRKAEGAFTFDEDTGQLSNLRIVVDAASVFTNHDKRDQHLRSDDFLDTGKYPQLVFTAQSAQLQKQQPASVSGELTLRGVTRPVILQATWNKSDRYPIPAAVPERFPYVLGASVRGAFKRSEFGMTYAVDNGWVGDTVELIIEFEARRQ